MINMKGYENSSVITRLFAALALMLFLCSCANAEGLKPSPAPEDAFLYFIAPQDGDVIKGPEITVKFGLKNMGVAPAGVDRENTGHHHLLVDAESLPDLGKPLGSDVKHFGAGQTEAVISLEKGEHTLQLILGNHIHMPHDPPVVSEKITITVE